MGMFHSYVSLLDGIVPKLENIPNSGMAQRTAASRLLEETGRLFQVRRGQSLGANPCDWLVSGILAHALRDKCQTKIEPNHSNHSHNICPMSILFVYVTKRFTTATIHGRGRWVLGSRRQARDRRIRQNCCGATCSRWGPGRRRVGLFDQKTLAIWVTPSFFQFLWPISMDRSQVIPGTNTWLSHVFLAS